jgi:hypothetical protein
LGKVLTIQDRFALWRHDWTKFAREVLRVDLDEEQQQILRSVQLNKMTSVASGTARGKDFVSAVASICFLYLTPKWNKVGDLVENTKVAMTAPTDRQIGNIMYPEISRLFNRAKFLPGRLVGYDIRTDNEEWFLTGFKADEKNTEAWSGFHAANTMFVVTEASGIDEQVYNAIEGNLQGNSRILLVFNDNTGTGYASNTRKSKRWNHFRLDSLNAPNVLQKRVVIPGQVDYEWVEDKVRTWCNVIHEKDFLETEGDFFFELDGVRKCFRPNDLFRVKVRGMAPKIASDILIPVEWIEKANQRWKEFHEQGFTITKPLRLGTDVAGMGRDSSCFCPRYGDLVQPFKLIQSGGTANHMEVAGHVIDLVKSNTDRFLGRYPQVFIDTIGEGAGVFSRPARSRRRERKCIGKGSCAFCQV